MPDVGEQIGRSRQLWEQRWRGGRMEMAAIERALLHPLSDRERALLRDIALARGAELQAIRQYLDDTKP